MNFKQLYNNPELYLTESQFTLTEDDIFETFLVEGTDFSKLDAELRELEEKQARLASNILHAGGSAVIYSMAIITSIMGLYKILKYLISLFKNSKDSGEKKEVKHKIIEVKNKILNSTNKLNKALKGRIL